MNKFMFRGLMLQFFFFDRSVPFFSLRPVFCLSSLWNTETSVNSSVFPSVLTIKACRPNARLIKQSINVNYLWNKKKMTTGDFLHMTWSRHCHSECIKISWKCFQYCTEGYGWTGHLTHVARMIPRFASRHLPRRRRSSLGVHLLCFSSLALICF